MARDKTTKQQAKLLLSQLTALSMNVLGDARILLDIIGLFLLTLMQSKSVIYSLIVSA